MNDEQLAAEAKVSSAALEALVLRHTRLVRSCARPLFLSGGDHEDLVQEGMIGLLSAIRSFEPQKGASFQAYAAICIRSRMISAIRAAASQKHAPLNESIPYHSLSFASVIGESPESDPEERLLLRERFDEFMQSLQQQLSATERRVLSLYLEGLSYSEISQRLGKPSKSVDNAIRRIRAKAARIQG